MNPHFFNMRHRGDYDDFITFTKETALDSELLIYTCKINYFDELSRRMKFL